ncbi:MAG: sulfur carrier protein ThiS [Candidatus Aceula lacicola]|nr:sulfur carrier protein ThiS [Candidatus Aceula lacicola]
MMEVRINGAEQVFETETTLSELLDQKGLNRNRVVVEYNAKIVDRNDLSSIVIKEKDIIEIVSFVGGG